MKISTMQKNGWIVLLALASMVALAGCGGSGGAQTGASGGSASGGRSPVSAGGGKPALEIAVIPKGTTHEYWKSIHAGAIKAQQELAQKGQQIHIKWQGPLEENDKNTQINIVETFIQQKVNGFVLAPLDSQALVTPVNEAEKAGIPVVILDSALNSSNYSSFVATDNKKGGFLAGQALIHLLGGKGRVLMMRYLEGSASTADREAGFLQAIQAAKGITLVSSDQYGGASAETAFQTGQNLMNRFSKNLDGVFTPNESTTLGMRLALKGVGMLGKVKFVGFDSDPKLIDALKAHEIQALVVQNPFKMGEEGVLTVVKVINKQPVPKRIDTGVAVVTPQNMNTPDMVKLLNPPLDQYLK
ncbi:MAG TPA: substrate-binding domain-containing protein [Armatimonadota bacterium]|nr:substrate-binding domain-containing protein [Armatimonadota bacterium]